MKILRTYYIIAFLSVFMMNAYAHGSSISKQQEMSLENPLEVDPNAEEMIKSYVKDYKNDRFASEKRIVGIEIPEGGEWSITITGKKVNDSWEVFMNKGLPKIPAYVYRVELETLKAIYKGKINALTAQGKAFASDYTPMSVREINGFTPTEEDDSALNAFSFHFWTKGFPEVVPFKENRPFAILLPKRPIIAPKQGCSLK